jgi:hypothetical protein
MVMADLSSGGLPLITICDEDCHVMSPYYSYPYKYLIEWYGFIEIGEL